MRGVEALRPDVVLIDIRLGGESGFDVARQLAAACYRSWRASRSLDGSPLRALFMYRP